MSIYYKILLSIFSSKYTQDLMTFHHFGANTEGGPLSSTTGKITKGSSLVCFLLFLLSPSIPSAAIRGALFFNLSNVIAIMLSPNLSVASQLTQSKGQSPYGGVQDALQSTLPATSPISSFLLLSSTQVSSSCPRLVFPTAQTSILLPGRAASYFFCPKACTFFFHIWAPVACS